MFNRKAFTLIESVLALAIFTTSLVLIYHAFTILKYVDSNGIERQNFLGILELRRQISLGHSFSIKRDELCMDYQAEESCFYLSNHKLIQSPGTIIYLIALEDLSWNQDKQNIYIEYVVNDMSYSYWAGWLK
jgi:prepilin-type N-terminal cleavage/methylation domain-containing protein